MRELRALVERGFFFQHITDDDGEILVIVGSYGWHGFYDRIHIWGEAEAVAARERSDHRPFSGNVVWTVDGATADVARAVLELPAPGTRGAPIIAKCAPNALWFPRRATG